MLSSYQGLSLSRGGLLRFAIQCSFYFHLLLPLVFEGKEHCTESSAAQQCDCHPRSETKRASSWTCLDLKPNFYYYFLFDQQKSASSINFYSHLQEMQIAPQSRCPRGGAGSDSSSATGWWLKKPHLVPKSNTVKSDRVFVLEPPPLQKRGAVVCPVFEDAKGKGWCPVWWICC